MKSPALQRGVRKGLRTLLQMMAAGSLTALVSLLAHGLSPTVGGAVLIVWGTVVSFLHNYLETNGTIPTLLPTVGLVTKGPSTDIVGQTVGTVDAVAQAGGQVVGDVVNTAGTVVGGVTGAAEGLLQGGFQ